MSPFRSALRLEQKRSFLSPGGRVEVQLTGKIAGIASVQEEFVVLRGHLVSESIGVVAHLRAPLVWAGKALVLMRRDTQAVRREFVFLRSLRPGEQSCHSVSFFICKQKETGRDDLKITFPRPVHITLELLGEL